MLRRCALSGLLLVGSLLLFAGGASADKPVREPFPAQEDATYAAGELCNFPVSIETLQNNEIVTTFSDGRQRLTGALKVRLTNVDTGESLIVNASGAGWATVSDTAFEVSGQGLWVLLQDSGDEPGPGIFLYKGDIEWEFEFASERLTVLSATGSVRNLCDDLA